jgi:hypothetical protein
MRTKLDRVIAGLEKKQRLQAQSAVPFPVAGPLPAWQLLALLGAAGLLVLSKIAPDLASRLQSFMGSSSSGAGNVDYSTVSLSDADAAAVQQAIETANKQVADEWRSGTMTWELADQGLSFAVTGRLPIPLPGKEYPDYWDVPGAAEKDPGLLIPGDIAAWDVEAKQIAIHEAEWWGRWIGLNPGQRPNCGHYRQALTRLEAQMNEGDPVAEASNRAAGIVYSARDRLIYGQEGLSGLKAIEALRYILSRYCSGSPPPATS